MGYLRRAFARLGSSHVAPPTADELAELEAFHRRLADEVKVIRELNLGEHAPLWCRFLMGNMRRVQAEPMMSYRDRYSVRAS